MASNKNAIMRYRILDNCFRNTGRRYFIEDLIEECNKILLEIDPRSKGISRRQVLEDIAFLESSEGGSIELVRHRDNRRVYYRYADPTFSINNLPLNEVELLHLKTAVEMLAQFKGMPQFDWIQKLLPKLNHGINLDLDRAAIMDFDSNEYLRGIEHLGTLYTAIYYKRVLQVSYQPFENEAPFDVVIHPYYLKQYNNRWFLFGYNKEQIRYDWNLALDRIIAIKDILGTYIPNTEINWGDYFDEIIGVTKPSGVATELVILHFKGRSGKYVETKPLHVLQHWDWLAPDLLEVRLDLVINFELQRLILSFGEEVEVISPESLKMEVANKLKKAYDQYSGL